MSDLLQGIYTLSLIYALQENPVSFENLLAKKDALTDDEMIGISTLSHQYQGVEKAFAWLERLPVDDYKDTIKEIISGLLQ